MAGARVRIAGTDYVFDAPEGEDLLEILQSNGYPVETSCGGVAACGLCRVTIEAGRDLLSGIRDGEVSHLGSEAGRLGARLACQSKVRATGAPELAELVVRVPRCEEDPDEGLEGRPRLLNQRPNGVAATLPQGPIITK
jgi:2Fe-2S ferredoxin